MFETEIMEGSLRMRYFGWFLLINSHENWFIRQLTLTFTAKLKSSTFPAKTRNCRLDTQPGPLDYDDDDDGQGDDDDDDDGQGGGGSEGAI